MGFQISGSSQTLTAQRALEQTTQRINNTMDRLATRRKLNSASDNAANLAIASKLAAELRGLSAAEHNANAGISLIQTAEGAMGNIGGILARQQELAIQAANGGLSDSDRAAIDQEFQALNTEIDRISATTTYNGQPLLSASATTANLQVGSGSSADDMISIELQEMSTSSLGLSGADLSTQSGAQNAMEQITAAAEANYTQRTTLGTSQNRISGAISNLQESRINHSASHSRLVDADIVKETSDLIHQQILQEASVAMLAQTNQNSRVVMSLLR